MKSPPAQALLSLVLMGAILSAHAEDPIPQGVWEDVHGPSGQLRGRALTLPLPSAPFPAEGFPWTDASVRIFVPVDYRDRGQQDLIVHFHGWNQNIVETLATHHYEDHLWASGSNAILVIPQGPDHAKSGKFGKLMEPGGLSALTQDVLRVLYRELDLAPVLGDLILTAHSGGYQAVAVALDAQNLPVYQVGLFDALYGRNDSFENWGLAGGHLRSLWTDDGGTLNANKSTYDAFIRAGLPLSERATQRSLRDAGVMISRAASDHDAVTREQNAYGEQLRWGLRHSRQGPRLDLRAVLPTATGIEVRWFSPHDSDLIGFEVQQSVDGKNWHTALRRPVEATSAQLPVDAGPYIRVRPLMTGMENTLSSDIYRVEQGASLLVVDAMERILDASLDHLSHDLTAKVSLSAGQRVATASLAAITEGRLDLSPFKTILWLSGESGPQEDALPKEARLRLGAWIKKGGHLLLNGNNILTQVMQDDPKFLSDVFNITPENLSASPAQWGRPGTALWLSQPLEGLSAKERSIILPKALLWFTP